VTRAPFRLLLTAVRVSRGVSALGATMLARLGPTRTAQVALRPVERDRRYVSIRLCFPTLNDDHPHPGLLPAHHHRHFVGRALDGVPPTETGDHRVSRRVGRFGGSYEAMGAFYALPWNSVRSSL